MELLYKDIVECQALVVEPNPTARSILVSQLREFGVGSVAQVSRAVDARRMLEFRDFDVVLCEQHFPGSSYSGQDLLEDLRRNNMLPFSTVFVMITSESSYDRVAEAAESALDSYLLKPHNAMNLGQRLLASRHRKKILKPIFDTLEAGDFETTARLCLDRFEKRETYWLYAARIGAEVLLRIGQHEAAHRLFLAILQAQALPWAKLGIARVQVQVGEPNQAIQTLHELTSDFPGYTDGYDVLGRIYLEQGELHKALDVYRLASQSTPGSISRLQKYGMMAFFMGKLPEATDNLHKASYVGLNSKMFDPQALVLLGFLRYQNNDSRGLQRCQTAIMELMQNQPGDVRLARFHQILRTLSLMRAKQLAEVINQVRQLMSQLGEENFDVESACNSLMLLSFLASLELVLPEMDEWADLLAMRHASSRATTELLSRAIQNQPHLSEKVMFASQKITALAQQALRHALAGNPHQAVLGLMHEAKRHCNVRLMDNALQTLERYRTKITQADSLEIEIKDWLSRYADSARVPALGQVQGRTEGGLLLRVGSKADTPADIKLEDFDVSA